MALPADADLIAALRPGPGGVRQIDGVATSIDWDADGHDGPGSIDDQTRQVRKLRSERELATQLPGAVRRVLSGAVTATASLELTGPAGQRMGEGTVTYWSPYNSDSPLYAKPREHRPTEIDLRVRTSTGPQDVPILRGYTRGVRVTGPTGPVEVEVLDTSERLRLPADIPTIVADDLTPGGGRKPGLNGTFLVDWILRNKLGRYLSPPPRAGCKVLCTMHGSAFPEIGDPNLIYSTDFNPPDFADDGFLQAIIFGGFTNTRCEIFTVTEAGTRYNFRMGPTRQIGMECWIKTTATSAGIMMVASSTNGQSLFINASGNLAVYLKTPDSGPHIVNTALKVNDGAWHYVGLHVAYGVNTCSITVRCDGTSATFGTPSGFNNTTTSPQPGMTNCHIGRAYIDASSNFGSFSGRLHNAQFSEEDIPGVTGWNNTYSSDDVVIHPSQNRLWATPITGGKQAPSAWETIQLIAEAEMAVALFDERDVFHYITRAALANPPYSVSQATLTTSTSIKQLSVDRSIDSVRNLIRIRGTQPVPLAARDVWSATSVIRVEALSSKTFAIGFDRPVANLDTSPIYAGASVGLSESRYRAATTYNGGSAVNNLTFSVSQFGAEYAFVTVTNPNNFPVFLVNPSGLEGVTPGLPALAFVGQPVEFSNTPASTVAVEKRDATSIARFGTQALDLPDNPYRQDLDSLDELAEDLLTQLKDPVAVLDDLVIIGDPLLQLLDRVTIRDPHGFQLDGDFRVVAKQLDYDEPSASGTGESGGVLNGVLKVRAL